MPDDIGGSMDADDSPLERYLAAPIQRQCNDPIDYWNRQLTAGIDPNFAQFCLNYLSAPGKFNFFQCLLF
jgi:hypothetical protein